MSRFGIPLISLWLLAGSVVGGAELAPPEATTLLRNLREHRAQFPSLTADFTEEKTSRLLSKPLLSQGTIAFQVPDKFRRELRGKNPSLTVSNGKQLWIYYPNFKEAELYTLGQRAFFDDSIAALTAGFNFHNIADFYRYEAFRETEGYRLVLTPKT
ncbi:MAG: outer membrane lipoprotein carrier protein LolA, partial [Verrucomicrobiota bacterium]|nr:outer membrane lipoprotein carrier protein LolA [Verrucomicrobiota bacterium]